MEAKAAVGSAVGVQAGGREATTTAPAKAPRRRRNAPDPDVTVRYFLPKDGSSLTKPELGRELTTEGEALIAALKGNQHFFAVTIWNAVAEVSSGQPLIVRQAVPRS